MANRQIDPDTYNVGYADAEQGLPYSPPFSAKGDIEQYRAGYNNYNPRDEVEPA